MLLSPVPPTSAKAPKKGFMDLPIELRELVYDEAWKSLDGMGASAATKVAGFGSKFNL
jgi:hypothetical protein